MAFDIIEDGAGFVEEIPPFKEGRDGSPPPQFFRRLSDVIIKIIRRFNGRISLGTGVTGHRAGNLDAQTIDYVTPATPDEEFAVNHGLKRTPVGVDVISRDAAGVVYDSRRGSWTSAVLYLKCDTASVTIKLRVY
jgi:hypothetical protein